MPEPSGAFSFEQVLADADATHGDTCFDEKEHEAARQQPHGKDEQQRDRVAEAEMANFGNEHQDDQEANRKAAGHAQKDGVRRESDSLVEQPQFPDVPLMLRPSRFGMQRLEEARAIDHPVQASGNDVQERPDPRE